MGIVTAVVALIVTGVLFASAAARCYDSTSEDIPCHESREYLLHHAWPLIATIITIIIVTSLWYAILQICPSSTTIPRDTFSLSEIRDQPHIYHIPTNFVPHRQHSRALGGGAQERVVPVVEGQTRGALNTHVHPRVADRSTRTAEQAERVKTAEHRRIAPAPPVEAQPANGRTSPCQKIVAMQYSSIAMATTDEILDVETETKDRRSRW